MIHNYCCFQWNILIRVSEQMLIATIETFHPVPFVAFVMMS